MALAPVITREQAHQFSRLKCPIQPASCGRTTLPVTGRGTVLAQGSRPSEKQRSLFGGHELTSMPDGEPAKTH